mgnify:CR=1 FL=1|tara:strand:- start:689 stop:1078 length:390 start_codon:yes stop_codon:yes gene_type:complete
MELDNNLDCEVKKKYICDNIHKIKNHRNYLDIVKFHDCPHTNNLNGIFVNLNTITDDVIDKFYYKLKNEIEDDAFNVTVMEKQIIEEEIEELLKENKHVLVREEYDIIKMDEFSEEQQYIINLSKKYKI